jgi:hypothetical protein
MLWENFNLSWMAERLLLVTISPEVFSNHQKQVNEIFFQDPWVSFLCFLSSL